MHVGALSGGVGDALTVTHSIVLMVVTVTVTVGDDGDDAAGSLQSAVECRWCSVSSFLSECDVVSSECVNPQND